MAHKYDLTTVPTKAKGPKKHHPWYKERLELKFLKTSRRSAAMEGAKWTFLAPSMDDFRNGVPSLTDGSKMISRSKVDPIPLVNSSSAEQLGPSKRSRTGRRTAVPPRSRSSGPNSSHTLYTKVGPRKQRQLKYLNEVEADLLDHPIALFSHLEESIPPELLEAVIDILDPMLKPSDSDAELSSSGASSLLTMEQKECRATEESVRISVEEETEENDDISKQTAIYQFPLVQTEEEKRRERAAKSSQKIITPEQESKVNEVTSNMVKWMEDLDDGKDVTMTEEMVKSLFASDYESNPALLAPIRVVELLDVPTELKLSYPIPLDTERCLVLPRWKGLSESKPRIVRSRYGAWYLPTSLWKSLSRDEPLVDPSEKQKESKSEEALKSLEMDRMIGDLYSAKAFKEYVIMKPGAHVPKMLKHVNLNPKQDLDVA